MHQPRASRLVASVALALSACGADSSPDVESERAAILRRDAATREAIEWMIESAPDMPPGWAHIFLGRAYRIAPADLTPAIEQALRRDARAKIQRELPETFEDPDLLQPAKLTLLLYEIQRRRNLGMPYRDPLARLVESIRRDEAGFWRGVPPIQRAVYVYLFDDLGVQTRYGYPQLVEDVTSAIGSASPERPRGYRVAGYFMTHLVLTRSRYLRDPIEPSEFAFMLPHLRSTLEYAMQIEPSDKTFDLVGELLMCLELLDAPDDATSRAARQALLDRQRPDGSWGADGVSMAQRTHYTMTAILGVARLPDTFRSDPSLSGP